jgi:hypothetical protein
VWQDFFMPMPMKPFYRYDLNVEIPATDVAVLVDALEGEEFSLRDRLGRDELRRQLEQHQLEIEVLSDESWPEFQRDIETLSAYLSEPISGREIYVEPGPDEPLIQGWVILGRRGESERLTLDLAWDADASAIVDRGIHKEEARRRWNDLPEWTHASLANLGVGRE